MWQLSESFAKVTRGSANILQQDFYFF